MSEQDKRTEEGGIVQGSSAADVFGEEAACLVEQRLLVDGFEAFDGVRVAQNPSACEST